MIELKKLMLIRKANQKCEISVTTGISQIFFKFEPDMCVEGACLTNDVYEP